MFLNYIHYFRGIAIVFIISGHCIRFFNWEKNPIMEKAFKAFLLNGTVMFVFIAGFLFQHLYYRYTYKQYLLNKFKNIIIPYIFISALMIFYLVFIEKQGHWAYPNLHKEPYYFQIVWFYLTGNHLAPLWFIPMITVFYLLYPIFVLIDRNVNAYYFILPVAITISILVHRPPSEANLIHVSLHFFSVYLLGMWFSHFKERIFPMVEKISYFLIATTVILLLIEIRFYEHTGVIYAQKMFFHNKELININFFQKLSLSFLGIYFLRKHEHFFNAFWGTNLLKDLATLSFGIYFIHYYFLDLLLRTRYIFHYELAGNMIYLMVLIFSIGFVCVVSLKLSKLILGNKSRYIIGC